MPRKVDRQQRRTLIADALMRVAAEHGLEAVSLRHVATEAGVTTGMVQHYFRTKAEMMAFAMTVVRERGEVRVGALVEALGPDPALHDLLRTLLRGVLPVDEASLTDAKVALAFLAYAAVRPEAAASLREETALFSSHVAGLLATAQAAGDVRPDLDPLATATGLLAMMEGLGLYLAGGHYSAETAYAAIDTQLGFIFT